MKGGLWNQCQRFLLVQATTHCILVAIWIYWTSRENTQGCRGKARPARSRRAWRREGAGRRASRAATPLRSWLACERFTVGCTAPPSLDRSPREIACFLAKCLLNAVAQLVADGGEIKASKSKTSHCSAFTSILELIRIFSWRLELSRTT